MRGDLDKLYWVNLSLANGVGTKAMARLLRAFGSPREALSAPLDELRRVVPKNTARNIAEDRRAAAEAAMQWAAADGGGRRILTWMDADFPQWLLETGEAPPVLYARGDAAFLQKPIIAIVGSRNASAGGIRNAELFARALSDAGVCVASGLAQGIDAAAHRGGLSGAGGTAAVVGTGMDIVYPTIHRKLADDIAQNGVLLGELPLGAVPHPSNFPRRNRIISGIARGCLVVEATLKSGSLITAAHAGDQGRDVFAVPGAINSPLHRGCHKLIREGAVLTETVKDILEVIEMPPAPPREPEREDYADLAEAAPGMPGAAGATAAADKMQMAVLAYIDYAPTTIDEIAERSGLDADKLLPELLELEIGGKIVPAGGGRYQRL